VNLVPRMPTRRRPSRAAWSATTAAMWRPGRASSAPGASSAMWAVLSGQTKRSAPARASLCTLVERVSRMAAWSPTSQAAMLRPMAMQSSVTSGCR
jgi:hypothetical protein